MNSYYRLDERTPVPCTLEESAFGIVNENRIVARTEAVEGVLVSTVFLVINHSFTPDGEPILFETMIFGGQHDQYQRRYSTYDEAEQGHIEAVAIALSA